MKLYSTILFLFFILMSGCFAAEPGRTGPEQPPYRGDSLIRAAPEEPLLINSTLDGNQTIVYEHTRQGCEEPLGRPVPEPRLQYVLVDATGKSVHRSIKTETEDVVARIEIPLHGPGPWIFAGAGGLCLWDGVWGVESGATLGWDEAARHWINVTVEPAPGSQSAERSFTYPPYTYTTLSGFYPIAEGTRSGNVTFFQPDGTPIIAYRSILGLDDYQRLNYGYFEPGDYKMTLTLDAPALPGTEWDFRTEYATLGPWYCRDWMDLPWMCDGG